MKITVAHITKAGAFLKDLDVPAGSTITQVIQLAGIHMTDKLGFAVWGHRVNVDHALKDGDRLEVAQPILIDPKAARERRAQEQGDIRVLTCGRHGGKHRKMNQ